MQKTNKSFCGKYCNEWTEGGQTKCTFEVHLTPLYLQQQKKLLFPDPKLPMIASKVAGTDLECTWLSRTVAQNDGFCAQGVLF